MVRKVVETMKQTSNKKNLQGGPCGHFIASNTLFFLSSITRATGEKQRELSNGECYPLITYWEWLDGWCPEACWWGLGFFCGAHGSHRRTAAVSNFLLLTRRNCTTCVVDNSQRARSNCFKASFNLYYDLTMNTGIANQRSCMKHAQRNHNP